MTKSQELEQQLAAAKKEEEKANKKAERDSWVALIGKTYRSFHNQNYTGRGGRVSKWRNVYFQRVTRVTPFDSWGRFELYIKSVGIVVGNLKNEKQYTISANHKLEYAPDRVDYRYELCSDELLDRLYDQVSGLSGSFLQGVLDQLPTNLQEGMREVMPLPAEAEAILDIPHAKLEPHESTHVPHEPFLIGYCYLLSPESRKAAAAKLREEEEQDARCSGFDCGRYLTDQSNARASVRRKLGI